MTHMICYSKKFDKILKISYGFEDPKIPTYSNVALKDPKTNKYDVVYRRILYSYGIYEIGSTGSSADIVYKCSEITTCSRDVYLYYMNAIKDENPNIAYTLDDLFNDLGLEEIDIALDIMRVD